MFYARLLAVITFAAFSLAAVGTLRLAIAKPGERPVWLHPRDSSTWMALGLEAEQTGDVPRATQCMLRAEQVDRQYLPAWTAANYFFRHSNDVEFWRAAAQAAAMSYDDPAPLIDLADHREAHAVAALDRLGDTPRLERGYLHYLLGQSRWREAQEVAQRLAARQDAQDSELLLGFIDRLLGAGEAQAALKFAHVRAGTVTNGDFRTQPSGHAFDWHVTAPPGGTARWDPARLRFWLASSTPDACGLLEQWVVFPPGRYRLRFQYQTEGLAEPTGMRWVVSRDGIEEASAPALAQAPGGGRNAGWNFEVKKGGVHQLRLVYIRVPGTIHREGHAAFASVAAEIL